MVDMSMGLGLLLRFVLVVVVARYVESLVVKVLDDCPLVIDESCPDNTNMHFVLFTRSDPTNGQTLDMSANNISQFSFKSMNPTKIIIHGFTDNILEQDYVDFRAAYFEKGEYNLIMVDWSYLAKGPYICYPSATVNLRHVGECTGGLIQLLRKRYQVSGVHVIGHSLGAQTARYVAQNVNPKLTRITGLDPAGPGFYGNNYVPVDVLSKSDASFVDIIHTNSIGLPALGRIEQMGHVDFYMNDGSNQPGCQDLDSVVDRASCSHHRSVLFYIESINSATGFYGKKCASLNEFVRGRWSTAQPRNILMGEYVLNTSNGVIAVPTRATSPFALGP